MYDTSIKYYPWSFTNKKEPLDGGSGMFSWAFVGVSAHTICAVVPLTAAAYIRLCPSA